MIRQLSPQLASAIRLAICLLALPAIASAQGPLTNGGNHSASISAPGEIDQWTFSATANDAVLIRIGETQPGGPDPGFWPWIQLYNPSGTLIGSAYNTLAAEVSLHAPVTGTYTVRVASADSGGDALGDYVLRLVKVPGALTVPDEGGALTNGANHAGHIDVGDMDVWTFTANQHEAALVRIGEVLSGGPDSGFWPWIRVYGPTGAYVEGAYNDRAAEVGFVAPLTGTYSVIVASADSGYDAIGNYSLRLARIPGTFTDETGGPLTNGANHPGRIDIGDLDVWTFTANQNEAALVRVGEVPVDPGLPDPGFWPWLRVYGPNGAYIGGSYNDLAAEVGFIAPLTGSYTVVVGSADSGYDAEGDYRLRLAKVPGAFTVPDGDQGGALTNGANHAGHIDIGDFDMWTFTANQNEAALVRIGEVLGSPDPGFWPWIRVYGPTGAFVEGAYNDRAAEVGFVAPLTGTYTVVVATADSGYDAIGDYTLRLARVPGTFTDENGGVMTNGANHPGRIDLGDLDTWTFTANQGDSAIVRIGEVPVDSTTPDPGFWPWIRVYGPTGAYIDGSYNDLAAEVGFNVPLTGTYTVVVASADSGYDAANNYIIRLARMPGAFSVAVDDHGGAMTNGVSHPGRIEIGDLDMWSFSACTGATVAITINEVPVPPTDPDPGFWPWIRLYNSLGALASGGSDYGNSLAQINHTVTQSGAFTLVVATADSGYDATGDYTVRVQIAGGVCGTVPTTVADAHSTSINTPLTIAAPGVLANDNSNGGGAMTAQLVTNVTSGSLALNANGSFTFTPAAGFTGTASFTYRAVNGAGAGNVATVTITVGGGVPTTVSDSYSTNEGTPLSIAAPGVLSNDNSNSGGALSAQLVTTTTNGILALAADGSLSYTPNSGFSGTDTFTYRAVNSVGPGNTAGTTITVTPTPTGPQPPTELYAAGISGNLVKLRFKAPTSGPAPTGYLLEGGLVPGQMLASIPTGSTNPIYVFSAPSGVFYVRMHTLVGSARSVASNEIRIYVNASVDPPSAPAHLTGLANGNSVALAWRNTFAGGAPANVVLDVRGSLNASLPLGLTDNFQFNGVPGGTYTLSVRAINATGSSPSSNAITLTFPSTTCVGPPLPPSEFLAYRLGSTIYVEWQPAAVGPAPTSYALTVTGSFNGTLGTPGRSLSGAVGRGTYHLSVAALNACGGSTATAVQTVVVP